MTLRIDVKILNFNEKQRDVVLVRPPRIKFSASQPLETLPDAKTGVTFKRDGTAPAASENERRQGGEGGGGTGGGAGREEGGEGPVVPLGGIAGTFIGGDDRDKDRSITSGFSLVYPADAMLNLSTYARVPEDEWLRPLRKLSEPPTSFSRYLHPRAGTRESEIQGGGGGGKGGLPGGIGTIKTPPAGVVAAFVPENVKTFDLSGWASAVLNVVQRNWLLAAEAGSEEWSGRVTITVLVMKNGELNGVDISASSSINHLDAAARRAVDASGPWPALPEGFPDTSLEIQLVFRYGR